MCGSITLNQFESLFWLMSSQKWVINIIIFIARVYNNINNNNNNNYYAVWRSLQLSFAFSNMSVFYFYYSTENNNSNDKIIIIIITGRTIQGFHPVIHWEDIKKKKFMIF